jgi:hypothetical protein
VGNAKGISMSDKPSTFIVTKEFLARRGTTPVFFPVGCQLADVIDDQSDMVTFVPIGASDPYVVDGKTFQCSIRRETTHAAASATDCALGKETLRGTFVNPKSTTSA